MRQEEQDRMDLITKQTFEQQTPDGKLSILFDQQVMILKVIQADAGSREQCEQKQNETFSKKAKECEERFKALERFHMWLTGGIAVLSFVLGLFMSGKISIG
jgi:hypothetical protein